MESLILSVELCRRSYSPTTYLLAPVVASSLDLFCLHANINIKQERLTTTKNWKNSICYQGQPLSQALESYTDPDGKRCCYFIGPSVASGLDIPRNSQPPGISFGVCLPTIRHQVFTNRKQSRHLNQ